MNTLPFPALLWQCPCTRHVCCAPATILSIPAAECCLRLESCPALPGLPAPGLSVRIDQGPVHVLCMALLACVSQLCIKDSCLGRLPGLPDLCILGAASPGRCMHHELWKYCQSTSRVQASVRQNLKVCMLNLGVVPSQPPWMPRERSILARKVPIGKTSEYGYALRAGIGSWLGPCQMHLEPQSLSTFSVAPIDWIRLKQQWVCS